ncbi:MAG: heat-shock protein Hsp15 [Marinilabiliales bacterium]|nr:MAG: heat-shock protein Hsp15 [Marinilabiliales bacterium]
MENNEVRIDRWLWAVRIFKTRSMATDACKKGRVVIESQNAKPSKMIRPGFIVEVKKPPITFTYEVIDVLENRVGAKLVENYCKNLTPDEELNKLKDLKNDPMIFYRKKGLGRPTKKERRDIDKFKF